MKRPLLFLIFVLLVAATHGQDTAFPKGDKVIEEKLKELDKSPIAIEYRDINNAIREIEQEKEKQSTELRENLQKIYQSEEYREYLKKRRDLESQRNKAWEVERKAIAEAAKKIYAARHEEIKGIAKAELPRAKRLGLDVLSYPRVDGSTSSEPMSVVIACRVLGIPYEWIYPEPTGYPWTNPTEVPSYFLPAARPYEGRNIEFNLSTLRVVAKPARKDQERVAIMINSLLAASTSTHDAYVNLIQGKSDLNLAARPPSESELKLAREKNVVINLEPVARDAFVFIVNQKNPVKGLTRNQVRGIYEEKITDWKDVGGGEGKIRAFRRERDSGSRELFDALVMQGQQLPEDKRDSDLFAFSMSGPYNQVTQDANGLGYSIYFYEHFMAASPFTRNLAIDGVEPNAETIASGKYPWVIHVYAAYREGEEKDNPGMKLMKWLVSSEGQAVVRESGYVPEK